MAKNPANREVKKVFCINPPLFPGVYGSEFEANKGTTKELRMVPMGVYIRVADYETIVPWANVRNVILAPDTESDE